MTSNLKKLFIDKSIFRDLRSNDYLYVDKSPKVALNQIKRKKYAEKFIKEGRKVHLLGVSFSSVERNITSFQEDVLKF